MVVTACRCWPRRPVTARSPIRRAAGRRAATARMSRRCGSAGTARARASLKRAPPAPARGPAFTCAADHCEQRHPRMPDAGEWQCMDSAGATICMGGERARPAWRPRPPTHAGSAVRAAAASRARASASICRPTFPMAARADGVAARCTTDRPRRACDRDPGAHTLAETCDARTPVRRRQPLRRRLVRPGTARARVLAATDDCAGGRCRFGSCLGGGREGVRARADWPARRAGGGVARLPRPDAPPPMPAPRRPAAIRSVSAARSRSRRRSPVPQLAGGRITWRQIDGVAAGRDVARAATASN